MKLLRNLIRRSRSCQYLRLLEKHCPPPLSDQDASAKESRSKVVKPKQNLVYVVVFKFEI